MRRRAQHRGALATRRVAAPDGGSDLDLRRKGMNLAARLSEVLVDVGRERLERRDVDDPHLVGQARFQSFAHELIKVRVPGLERDARDEAMQTLCERTGAESVQAIGKVLVIYRKRDE